MAQTRKKRRKKRRGTQAGQIDTKRRSRPKSRAEAKSQARSGSKRKPATRLDRPPTWKSATIRGVIAAVVFMVLLIVLFGRPLTEAVGLALFMLVFYIPAGYYMDTFMWRRRERARIRSGRKQ
ncbi:MAG: hypothetical protein ACO3CR_00870 [Solirubrobacterales bacterium]